MKYKNYIFDLYGTLVDNGNDELSKNFFKKFTKWLRKNGYAFTWREFSVPYLEIEKAHRMKPSPFTFPEIAIEPVFKEVFALKGYILDDEAVKLVAEGFRKISTKYIRLYPDTIECLESLKAQGKKIYLLSNAQRSYTWPELEMLGLIPYFDGILISSDEKCMKPDPAFMDILCERYGLDKSESIMIGNDIRSDVGVANAAGVDSMFINRNVNFDESLSGFTYASKEGAFLQLYI